MSADTLAGPHHARSPDGTHIAWWSTGEGPPLLLVHGSMSDHHRWRITPWLARHRTVHLMDRRGRGGSGDAAAWSPDREVEDVVAVIDALAVEAYAPVDVLGHSLGGYLALRAAARTGSVRRLVLYEPAIVPEPQPAAVVAGIQAAVDRGDHEGAVEVMLREVLHMPEQQIEFVRRQPSWPARVATAPTLPREEGTALLVEEAEAAAVGAPTLLVEGSESPAFLREAVGFVGERVPSARVVTLEGHQHVADQTDPEMFAGVVLDFLLGETDDAR